MFGFILILSIVASITSMLMAIICHLITKNETLTIGTFMAMLLFFIVGGIYVINQNQTSVSSKTYHLLLNSEGHTQYSTTTDDDSNVDMTYIFTTNSGKTVEADNPNKITYNATNQSKLIKTTYDQYLTLFGHKFHLDSYTKNHIYIIK